ncbi:hypothetical protein FA13DRAFT_395323 [Coprinellus micaceus]|jgi:hypothetical protein|uniref:Uncharacterized protein n=1 Tax=Coprinellus micaceus TaxID=71717 RepID=A0A4Y7TX32_COPMI|nr:hypothetical protein FA13DRAFT_395323 [Coprinellus micaceus]
MTSGVAGQDFAQNKTPVTKTGSLPSTWPLRDRRKNAPAPQPHLSHIRAFSAPQRSLIRRPALRRYSAALSWGNCPVLQPPARSTVARFTPTYSDCLRSRLSSEGLQAFNTYENCAFDLLISPRIHFFRTVYHDLTGIPIICTVIDPLFSIHSNSCPSYFGPRR